MATLTLSEELGALAPLAASVAEERPDLKSQLLAYERRLITAALAECGGNQRRAARQLGVLPTTLHEKMKRLGLRAEAFLPQDVRPAVPAGAAPRLGTESGGVPAAAKA
jgi:DNA-binding NtrC family response regulator